MTEDEKQTQTEPLVLEQKDIPAEATPESTIEVESASVDPSKTFFIALGVFIVILAAIFLIPRFFHQEPKTLTDIHEETIAEDIDTELRYVYNGYSFVYYDGLWYTQILNQFSGDLYNVPLHFGPKNLTDIIITGDLDPFFQGILSSNISNQTFRYYLTFDPSDPELGTVALAAGELTQNLVTTFNIAPVSACTAEGIGCEQVPIISCNTTTEPVIYLKSGQPTLVYADGVCLTIQGEGPELVRAADRLLLKLYNIMI